MAKTCLVKAVAHSRLNMFTVFVAGCRLLAESKVYLEEEIHEEVACIPNGSTGDAGSGSGSGSGSQEFDGEIHLS